MGEWAFNLLASAAYGEMRKLTGMDEEDVVIYPLLVTIFPPLLQRDHAAYLTTMHAFALNAEQP